MNKLLLLGAMALTAATQAFAAQNLPDVKLWLNSKETASELDYFEYTYNEANQCDSCITFRIEADNDMFVNYGYHYNELGLQVSELGYQRLKRAGQETLDDYFTHTTRVFFTWDDLGRLKTRINYNWFFGDWERGGVYAFYYDGDNSQPSCRKLFWDEEQTDLFEETDYEYNDQGLVVKESYLQKDWGSGEMELSQVKTYEYDAQGRLTYRYSQVVDYNSGELEDAGTDRLTYDDNGDIVEELWYQTSPQNPMQRLTYTFRPELRTEVAYPINLEDDNYNLENSVHAVDTQSTYAIDQNSGTLQLYEVYTFYYASERPMISAVHETVANSMCRPAITYNNGTLELNNFAGFQQVTVVDMAGRTVKQASICRQGTVALDGLQPGVYCVVAGEKTLKFAVK